MSTALKRLFLVLAIVEFIVILFLFIKNANVELLNPQGPIAREQMNLILTAIAIMLVVAIPLVSTMYFFAFKYRAGRPKSTFSPNTTHGRFVEFVWWIVPSVIILILALITWNKTHALDPYRALHSAVPPVRIQVVALQWKWLFLYPDYNIATVNYIQFPEKTPVNFELTADAPMNSFWIPSLSGQIYAMTGMSTKLHIMADKTGNYRGQAAEINGAGFSGMKFVARSSDNEEFSQWVSEVRRSSAVLDLKSYTLLSKPTTNHTVEYYGSYDKDLYNKIIMKFMMPQSANDHVKTHQ